MKTKYRLKAVVIIILMLALASCKPSQSDISAPTELGNIGQSEELHIKESTIIYTSYDELVKNSEFIILGVGLEKNDIVNTARDPDNPEQLHPSYFGIGQVYLVKAEKYIKGDGPESIFVIQNQGMVLNTPTVDITEEEIESARTEANILPLSLAKKYIMFLNSTGYSYAEYTPEITFIGRGHPWLFEVTNSECVRPEDSRLDVRRFFIAQPLNEFLTIINNPSAYEGTNAYPGPIESSECQNNSLETNQIPYP